MEIPLNQSSPKRAWQDTEHFRNSAKSFWLLEVVGAAMFGVGGAIGGVWLTPLESTPLQQTLYPIMGGGIGIILGFIIVFTLILAWNLFRAPYRQRDEARKRLIKLEGNLGQVGYIEAFMFDGIENRNKLKSYKSRGSTLDDFELNKFHDWYRDVSEYLQKNIYSEYPYWYQTVDTGLIKLTLDDAVKAYESGLGILRDIQIGILRDIQTPTPKRQSTPDKKGSQS